MIGGNMRLKAADMQIMVPTPDGSGNVNWWKITLGTYRIYGSVFEYDSAGNGIALSI
jgi:hypothetical protein